jgi:excisionase family DNA binding protein
MLYLTKKQAAACLGVTVRTIDNWRNKGILSCLNIGGIVRFPAEEFERELAAYVVRRREGESTKNRGR